jgi:predicted nucleic acid-binding protein
VILVDSSVWIDFFRNEPTVQAEWLDRNLGIETLVVGDLILAEVLRGFKDHRGFNEARRLLAALEQLNLGGEAIAVASAKNFRKLRAKGVTVRGAVDVIIATLKFHADT